MAGSKEFQLSLSKYLMLMLFVLSAKIECYEKQSKCLSEKSNNLKIACPANKITRIVKAFYGYSWSGDCHFIEKDCIVDVPNEDLSCLGEGCTVKIIESPIVLQECWHLMASYVQIDYECISVEQLQNMCGVQESELSVGYIVTPDYPSMLMTDLSCPCTMMAPAGYTVTIEVLDFRLSGCSQTGLTIWSDSSTYTHCLSIATGVLPGSGGQNISMRLHSQTKKNNAGFLLKYYSTPINDQAKIKFICYGSTELWTSNKVNSISRLNASITAKSMTTTTYEMDDGQYTVREGSNNVNWNPFAHVRSSTVILGSNNSVPQTHHRNSSRPGKSTSHAITIDPTRPTVMSGRRILNSTALKGQSTLVGISKSSKLDEKATNDWTVIIISIVASVIFLLVMINALIWFIFSLKGDDDKLKAKKLASSLYPENYYPTEYFKGGFQSDDEVYAAAAAAVAAAANNISGSELMNPQHQNNRLSYLSGTSDCNSFWKTSENLNAFTNSRYLSGSHNHLASHGGHPSTHQAQQLPTGNTTTWPRNSEITTIENKFLAAANANNLKSPTTHQSLPYGFSFSKTTSRRSENNNKQLKEDKKKFKEWKCIQEEGFKKIKDEEMQQFLCSTVDSNSSSSLFMQNPQRTNNVNDLPKRKHFGKQQRNKYGNSKDHHQITSVTSVGDIDDHHTTNTNKRRKQPNDSDALNKSGFFNWGSKYPEIHSYVDHFENPAMIIDEEDDMKDKYRMTEKNGRTLKTTSLENDHKVPISNNSSDSSNSGVTAPPPVPPPPPPPPPPFFPQRTPGSEKPILIQYTSGSNETASPGATANRRRHHLHHNQDYLDDATKDESIVAMSDTIMLKSASQVPMNSNPIYMYEEQEGSIDLRSEYSFQISKGPTTAKAYSRNTTSHLDESHMHNSSHMNTTSHHHYPHHGLANAAKNRHHNDHHPKKKKYAEKDIQNWNEIY